MNSNELQHWGVKGMRWGVRKKSIATMSSPSSSNKQDDTARKRRNLGFKVAAGVLTVGAIGLTAMALVNRQKAKRAFEHAVKKESIVNQLLSERDWKVHYDPRTGINPETIKGMQKQMDEQFSRELTSRLGRAGL